MKIKPLIALIMGFVLNSQLYADDASNPCGALLCILGGQTSGECKKYYQYYTIEIPKKCAKKCKYASAGCTSACISTTQIQHLKNCKTQKAANEDELPLDSAIAKSNEQFLANLDGNINRFSQLRGDCTQDELNSRIEKTLLRVERHCDENATEDSGRCWNVNIYGYRVNPTPTNNCQILSSQQYSLLKINYDCEKTFYEQDDWKNGYTKTKISKQEFDNLPSDERLSEVVKTGIYPYKNETFYYKKNFINKQCWKVWQE